MLDLFIALLIIVCVFISPVILIAIGSLIEEYIVNKTIKFKSWKTRFYIWIDRVVKYWE
jgi:hypothetical protein